MNNMMGISASPNGFLADSMSEPCRVCGEPSSGYHCGSVTCEACKKFFLRSINGEHKKYKCLRNQDCVIMRTTRTQCQYCRYKKCQEVGMTNNPENPNSPTVAELFKTVACWVCSASSSGVHFGAITCEGCKGFFRRSIKERAPERYKCMEQGKCGISAQTRNMCRFCRYQACLRAGMSSKNSRIGRQSNLFKHYILELQNKGCTALTDFMLSQRLLKIKPEHKHNIAAANSNSDTMNTMTNMNSNMSSVNNELDYDISELSDILFTNNSTLPSTGNAQVISNGNNMTMYSNGNASNLGAQMNADGSYNRDYYYNNVTNDYYYQNGAAWNGMGNNMNALQNGATNNNNVNEPNRNLAGSDVAARATHHQMLPQMHQHDQMNTAAGYNQKPIMTSHQIQQYNNSIAHYGQPQDQQQQQQYQPQMQMHNQVQNQYQQQANYIQQPANHNLMLQHHQPSPGMEMAMHAYPPHIYQAYRNILTSNDYTQAAKSVIVHVCSAYDNYLEPIQNMTRQYAAVYAKESHAGQSQSEMKMCLGEIMGYLNLYANKFREFSNAIFDMDKEIKMNDREELIRGSINSVIMFRLQRNCEYVTNYFNVEPAKFDKYGRVFPSFEKTPQVFRHIKESFEQFKLDEKEHALISALMLITTCNNKLEDYERIDKLRSRIGDALGEYMTMRRNEDLACDQVLMLLPLAASINAKIQKEVSMCYNKMVESMADLHLELKMLPKEFLAISHRPAPLGIAGQPIIAVNQHQTKPNQPYMIMMKSE